MRKTFLGLAVIAAIATPLAFASSANAAGTPRCQETVSVTSNTTAATFTALQPKGTVGQFDDVWKHDYTITVTSDGHFDGLGSITANGVGDVVWTEMVKGQLFDTDDDQISDHVSFDTVPVGGGATFKVTNVPMDSTPVHVDSTWADNIIEFRIAPVVFETVTVNGETDFANHGEYVAALGGGKAVAQKCAGMPLVSKEGK
jgi:hypothetical protein